jgi:hypothetical protein
MNTQRAVKSTRRKPSARRVAKSAKLLTREQRVQEAVKIIRGCKGIEPDSCEGSIANILDWLERICPLRAALRRSSSKEAKLEEKRVLMWLRRGKVLLKNLYQWPAGFESFQYEVTRWAAVYEEGERLSRLPRLGIGRTTAYDKQIAAEAALHLCDEFGVKLTKTKRSAFCRLAAVLYGDKDADLQKHCMKVVAPNYRTSLTRVAPNRA